MIDITPHATYGAAHDVNPTGVVVGAIIARAGGPIVAFRWTAADGLRELGTLGGSYSQALAVNDDGVIVGASDSPNGMRAFRWTSWTGMQDLGALPPNGVSSAAFDINQKQEIVGSSTAPDGSSLLRSVKWVVQR